MLKVAVIDSGINPGHSHVGPIYGGVSFVSENWADFLGHGTAVAAAIRDHEPRVELYAVKIFDRSFATEIEAVLKALEWCAQNTMEVVNLSLATAKIAYARLLEEPSRRINILIAPCEFVGLPAYPGSFSWVFGVSSDERCPREKYIRVAPSHFAASPIPRTIPGLQVQENFSGLSFAVANFTGLVCRTMLEHNIRTADQLRECLLPEGSNTDA
jgi:hypothetical protein